MEKRYQVFVSSTYEDLIEERQEVMQALLELDCIPFGMELFPAANDDQWTLIKRVIDDCDYYIVIIGGRYGSVGSSGVSYTQMEYQYAIERGMPVMPFCIKTLGVFKQKKTERTQDGKEKLESFRSLAQQKMCNFWSTPAELGSVVSRSLVKLIKTNPAIGWVKADLVPDQSATEEILKLRNHIEELKYALSEASAGVPQGTEDLAQGDDEITIRYVFEVTSEKVPFRPTIYQSTFKSTWNEIFSRVSPLMIDEATEVSLKNALSEFCEVANLDELRQNDKLKNGFIRNFAIADEDFQTIKIQLRALNLITKSKKQRSVKDKATYWTLTPSGDLALTRLRAIRKKPNTATD